jgi:biopolymer transport protein ExbD
MVLPHSLGEKVEIPQPSPEIGLPNPEAAIVIQLHDAGNSNPPALTINKEKVAADALEKRLREIFRIRTERVAFVKGDPEIDFQYVAEVVDIAHHAGTDRVGLMGTKE